MGTMQKWFTTCGNCHKLGPEGRDVSQARRLAEQEGWLLGQRKSRKDGGKTEDYCSGCRLPFEIRACGECGAKAVYELSRDDESHRGCGRHYGAILRDMFHTDLKAVTITKVNE